MLHRLAAVRFEGAVIKEELRSTTSGPNSPAARRRLWWRRFVERGSLRRHPVSLVRQRLGRVLLAALLLGLTWYALATRDQAVRRRAIEFLSEVTGGQVEIERAQFRMFGGITLYGVRVSVPFSEQLDPSAVDPESREVFSATSLRLVHNTWRLLFGSLRVERIVAAGPKIVLAHNVETGLRNWQLLSPGPDGRSRGDVRHRVKVTIRSAVAEIVSIDGDGSHEARTEELDADIRPHPQLETAYLIEVRRFTDPPERTTVIFDPGARLVINTPFVDARTIRLQLPKPAQEFFDRITLRGEVKLTRLIYEANAPEDRETAIELRRVRCEIPLALLSSVAPVRTADGASGSDPPSETAGTAIKMTEVHGRLTLRGGRLALDVSGLVDGAECKVVGHLEDVDGPPDRMGVSLQVRGSRVAMPEGAVRKQLLTDPGVPADLWSFLRDYDPHGPFDLDFRLARAPGESQEMRLSGSLRPQGASASCRWFAYPVEDLHGLVRFEPGGVYIEDVRGRHGPTVVRVHGRVDSSTHHVGAEVDIAASDVALDADLFGPLSDRYKSVWRRFNPQGTANITVGVRRPGADEGDTPPGWRTGVTADLLDGQICFSEYPYPLQRVRGRVEISGDRISFNGLTGHRGEASVRIDGFATLAGSDRAEVELRIRAESIPLDDTLASVLPPEGRDALAQFRPEGLVDLVGTVALSPEQPGLVYDLRAKLREATLCYEQFPYRLSGVTAEVAIRPDNISVISATGRHGTAEVTATGNIRRRGEDLVANLTLDCRRLALDGDLLAALPGPLKDVWRVLRPSGVVRARTHFHYTLEKGRRRHRHRTEIEAVKASLCFRGFPLPLSSVAASVSATDRRIEIHSLRARVGDPTSADDQGTIELSGQIDAAPPGTRGNLRIHAQGMTFSEELLTAMPTALRQALESIKPRGGFDLWLDPLRFDFGSSSSSAGGPDDSLEVGETAGPSGEENRWDFAGRLRLRDAYGRLGLELRNVSGEITGTGSIRRDGAVLLDARADLSEAVLAGWHLENISAHILAARTDREVGPGSSLVHIQDLSANAYGGAVSGFAEIELPLGKKPVSYQMSVAARDVQLGRYLQVHAPSGEGRQGEGSQDAETPGGQNGEEPRARGSIQGNLILRGTAGRRPYREGAGEILVRDAQIWKLPLVFAIFQVVNLTPDENVFHGGRLTYVLSQDDLTFERIDLQGKAMSFVGGGRMDLRTGQLDLTLLAGSPVRIRLPLLTELWEGAWRELLEIRILGTLEEPRIVPRPLRSLGKVLGTLFPEAPPRSPRSLHRGDR